MLDTYKSDKDIQFSEYQRFDLFLLFGKLCQYLKK